MNFIIGGRGRLGRALVRALGETGAALDRSVYADWSDEKAADDVARFFEPYAASPGVIYIAAGVTDPSRAPDDHLRVNLHLPRNVIEGASRHGFRVVTFGTIMEEIVGRSSGNPYYDSKVRLGDYVSAAAGRADVLHLRIHTLYGGGAPDRFMFLGQMLDAIDRNVPFRMSAGLQLREYHHVDDDVAAATLLAGSGLSGAVDLSHGSPIRLRDLAIHVCEHFQFLDKLELGAIGSSTSENFDRIFPRQPLLRDIAFRDTASSVVEELRACRRAASSQDS